MQLYHNIENDLVIDITEFNHRQQVIQQLKAHFSLFGYQEIHTSPFEEYDLYVKLNESLNREEMLKIIDNTGKVLVLRPDITIPLTQLIANHNSFITEDLRYFYILDVFRQKQGTNEKRHNTQAGIEFYGNPTPEADAEVIFLAIDSLKKMQFQTFKIELGHSLFFTKLIENIDLPEDDLKLLKHYIQAKNIPQIEQFLKKTALHEDIQKIVVTLPFLYGDPRTVLRRAKALPLPENMIPALDSLSVIYDNLIAYGVNEYIVIDLSLINHMGYYSDMIFQGFIENIGKPIIMGGRYDTLAAQFGANIPASGFACDLDGLVDYIPTEVMETEQNIDVKILYDKKKQKESMQLATKLRELQNEVVLYPKSHSLSQTPKANETLFLTEKGLFHLDINNKEKIINDLTKYIATKEKE